MKANRRLDARVEPLESRRVLSEVRYNPATIAGRGTAYETSSTPLSGGGLQVVYLLEGRASDLGPFQGAINYDVGTDGGPLSGTGVILSVHKYELAFVLSGAVVNTPPYTTGTTDDIIFQVEGGTKRLELATGQGQIIGTPGRKILHLDFRINGQLEQVK